MRIRHGCSPLLLSIVLEILGSALDKKEKYKLYGLEKIELSLFRDEMFVYVENPKQSTKKETWDLKITIIYNSTPKHEILRNNLDYRRLNFDNGKRESSNLFPFPNRLGYSYFSINFSISLSISTKKGSWDFNRICCELINLRVLSS